MKIHKVLKYKKFSQNLKTVDCNRSMSSNPIASAILLHRRARHWRALSFLGFGKPLRRLSSLPHFLAAWKDLFFICV